MHNNVQHNKVKQNYSTLLHNTVNWMYCNVYYSKTIIYITVMCSTVQKIVLCNTEQYKTVNNTLLNGKLYNRVQYSTIYRTIYSAIYGTMHCNERYSTLQLYFYV